MSDVIFREARVRDLASIVAMLADDELGRNREDLAGLEAYSLLFGQIEGDANNCILVGERQGVVIACLQLSFIRGFSRKGAMRALIEGVRVASSERRSGVGAALMQYAIGVAREAGCQLLQLTSDKRRDRAHSFYRKLGFVDTHEGFKLELAP